MGAAVDGVGTSPTRARAVPSLVLFPGAGCVGNASTPRIGDGRRLARQLELLYKPHPNILIGDALMPEAM